MTYKKRDFNKVNDWDIVLDDEVLRPIYNDEKKGYHITMDKVIESINTSKYPLNGGNVWLPNKNGDLIPLPDWIKENGGGSGGGGGGSGGGGAQETKQYRIEMLSSKGNIIKDKYFNTTLKVTLYEDNKDVTAIKNERYFKWARVSGSSESDQISDAEWNLKWSAGAKQIPISADDVKRNAMFQVQFVTESDSQLWIDEAYKAYINKINNKK